MATVSTITPRYAHQLVRQNGLAIMEDLQIQNISNEDGVSFYRGALLSLNATLGTGNQPKVKLGCGDADMPMWALNGSADFGVAVNEYTLVTGNLNLVPGTAAVELITTEFVSGSYAPNDKLTPATAGDAGKLKEAGATYSDHLVCGMVTRGAYTDHNGIAVLAFLPMVQLAINASGYVTV